MTISYRWLQEYIDLPESPEELAHTLTSTGLEVESVTPLETIKGGLKGLVIGEVLTCVKHPNADKLSLTTVNVGGPQPLSIVCGAPNVAVGQKVVVAIPGTTLYPAKGEPFFVSPAFEEDRAREQIGGEFSPFGGSSNVDVRTWQEDESPYLRIIQGLKDRGIAASSLGMEETTRFVFGAISFSWRLSRTWRVAVSGT